MLNRKNFFIAAICLCTFSQQVNAIETQPHMPEFKISTDIIAGKKQSFSVPAIVSKIKITCSLNTQGHVVHFQAHLKAGQGEVNDKKYYAGDTVSSMAFQDNDSVKIIGRSGAAGHLLLLKEKGVEKVTATCSISL